ncbi:MAG: YbdD/YjiX family protein [Gemmatimonadales bacterium]
MWARRTWGAKVQEALGVVRRVAGMPDYAAHVAHLRRCHPERAVPTAREFYEEYVRARYGDGPTRCC